MVYLSALNSDLLTIVLIGAVVVLLASVLKYFRQPYVIAYILAGVLIGKHGFGLITDEGITHIMSEVGLILLLFFVGMETSLPKLISNWKVPTVGTILQVIGSILLVGLIGLNFDWSTERIVVLGFIISLSSSAVVINLLQHKGESQTKLGQSVISILLIQDILIVPLLIITSYLGGISPSNSEILMQVIGGLILIGFIVWILRKREFSLPFGERMKDDHEMQVFFALTFCFGFAILTAFFGLSAALGAFVGGMVVHAASSTEWFHDSLHSFRVVFVALFFISIGMMIDLTFLYDHWKVIGLLVLAVLLGNHFINSAVIRFLGEDWKDSLYGGALLAQIGELSFLLGASAYSVQIISNFEYQLTIIVISSTLLISPFWIGITKWLLGIRSSSYSIWESN